MLIKNLQVNNNIFLAPMAGLTDLSFRNLCRENSCGLAFTEMISTNGIIYKNKKTFELLKTNKFDRPLGVQIFGHEPEKFSHAIKILEDNFEFDLINLNMGCPAKKIIRNGDGAGLLNNFDLIYKIIRACLLATRKPITVKIRKLACEKKTLELAKLIAHSGADMLIIHARTAAQKYSGTCDINIIKKIKANIFIPVVANGDIKSLEDSQEVFKKTNCDAIMIGRAALGNAFLFKQIKNQNSNLILNHDKIKLAQRHLEITRLNKLNNYLSMRKHISFYIKNFYNSKEIKCEINKCVSYNQFENLLNNLSLKYENTK